MRDGDLADVMEHPGHGDLPEEGLRQADHEAEADRDDGHVHRVVEGVLVVGLDAREAEHQRRALEDLLQERRGEDAQRSDLLHGEGGASADGRLDVAECVDGAVVGSSGRRFSALLLGLHRRTQPHVGQPLARRPRRRLAAHALGHGLEERVHFAWLHPHHERDAPDLPLVLADREELTVEEALPGEDPIVGDENVAQEAVHEPPVRAQVGGQRVVQRLLGFDGLGVHRWIERGRPDHAVQAPEDVRRLLGRATGHRRPWGRPAPVASGRSASGRPDHGRGARRASRTRCVG